MASKFEHSHGFECFDFHILQVGADVLEKLVNTALSLIDIQYVKFDVLMNGVAKRFKFVSTPCSS